MTPLPSLPPKLFNSNLAAPAATSPSVRRAGAPVERKSTPNTRTTTNTTPTKRDVLPTSPSASARKKPALRSPPKSRAKPSSTRFDTRSLRNDRLGTLVRDLCSKFEQAESWESFVHEFRGPSYLSSEIDDLEHPAAPLLQQWRDEGVPARSTDAPWTVEQKDTCVQRGCHKSANEHRDFIREEMAGFIDDRFWMVLPYDLIKDLEDLMLWPAAIKEERERKPRLLCDHSWNWGWDSINDTTVPHAPPEAMQFGNALARIMQGIRHSNPKFGAPKLAKHDVKDGFYRLYLKAKQLLHLALLLPRYDDEPQLIAIPMSCTMGWTESPPTFSTMSETICDDANASFQRSPLQVPEHRLEAAAQEKDDYDKSLVPRNKPQDDALADLKLAGLVPARQPSEPVDEVAPPSNCALRRPLGTTDVFVDDFIQLGQGGRRRLNALRRHLLHSIDKVLAMPDVSPLKRNEAVSLKKLLKGDGSWGTRKVILGWILDTVRQTIELPPHRKTELATLFADLQDRKRVSEKYWQRTLGKLRFVSTAIPGSAGLFSALQLALNRSSHGRIRVTRHLRAHIDAFAALAADLSSRPTHLAELVPEEPMLMGTTDAAKAGMGGVYYGPDGGCYVWRHPFSPDVQQQLVSADNLSGRITNSDLEQAGLLAQASLMCTTHDTRYATLANGCDNTPTVGRTDKGAVASDGPAAYLCHYASAHQRAHRYCHRAKYLPGLMNVMADDASRLQHLTDSAFLAHFQQKYPQPQPWQLLHLPDSISSQLTSALLSRSPAKPLPPSTPAKWIATSGTGSSSAENSTKPHPSVMSLVRKTASPTSLSSGTDTDSEDAPTDLSGLTRWIRPYWRLARASSTWTNLIPDSKRTQPSSIPYYLTSSERSATRTTPKPGPTQPTSPSSELFRTHSTSPMKKKARSTNTCSTSSSSPSTGCCAPPNTSKRQRRDAAKRSCSATSHSPSTEPTTPLLTHL